MSLSKFVALALVLSGSPVLAQSTADTPPPATNQCWDTSTQLLRDKTSATSAIKSREVAIGRDQSPGAPAPLSGNAVAGNTRNPNPVRPPGVSDC
jgi:hypothetical protein